MMHRPLRVAFVMTLSVGAPLACSHTSAPPFGNPPRQPEVAPADASTATQGGGAATCPATAPLSGSACSLVGQRCTYESCGVADGAVATCTAAVGWQTERVTCNPPPPPPPAR